MYRIGTIEEYSIDDTIAKQAAGWTQDQIANGKVVATEEGGYVINNILPKRQNPNNDREFIWESSEGDIEDYYNIISSWDKRIHKPKTPKYYIANNNGKFICGRVNSDSCVNFGSNVTGIKIFNNESDFLERAEELKITIENLLITEAE